MYKIIFGHIGICLCIRYFYRH